MTSAPAHGLLLAYSKRTESPIDVSLRRLNNWMLHRDYAGYEPYDVLNSPLLGKWAQRQPFATFFIQSGKRVGGLPLRRWLSVPASRNPKALGLVLSAYCDLARAGWETEENCAHVIELLSQLRSPGERDWCWGYDWHYVSLRGATFPAFRPNSIATVFCAEALLDHAETFHDNRSLRLAESAANWLLGRLTPSVNDEEQLCLSYTPDAVTRILNNNALIGAFFARLSQYTGLTGYGQAARRLMQFVVNHQAPDGSWPYGLAPSQRWIDSFHTGYNLCALEAYRTCSGDRSFDESLACGYEFYVDRFLRADGAARYFHNATYPIDIHSCSQAILTSCAFAYHDNTALSRARNTARWAEAHLRNDDGSFGYQVHRFWTDRTPYLRWSQAWMLRALARLRLVESSR